MSNFVTQQSQTRPHPSQSNKGTPYSPKVSQKHIEKQRDEYTVRLEERLKKLETMYTAQEERLSMVQNLVFSRFPNFERRLTMLQEEFKQL